MNKTKFLYWTILFFIMSFALYIRFYTYIQIRPLWHDECSLAINILNKHYFDYFGILQHQQSAPPLFMILTKFLASVINIKEATLRLIPLISSLVSIPIFFMFSKKILNNKFSIIAANFLFGINYYLIYYAQEFKQYSVDVLMFLITFIILSSLELDKLSYKKILGIGAFLAIIPLISMPSVFVIFAYYIDNFFRHKQILFKKLTVFITPVSLSSILLFITILLPSKSEFLLSYWNDGFFTLNINKIIVLLSTNLNYYFYPNKFILFILILIIAGIYYIFKDRKIKNNSLTLLTVLLIISASFLRLYPMMQRVSLYLTPLLIILITKPLDFLYLNKKLYSIFIICLFFSGLCSYNLKYFKSLKLIPSYTYDARSVMQKLKEHYNEKDLIVINVASDSEFLYYKEYFKLNSNNYVFVQTPNKDKDFYFQILDTIPLHQKIWFFYVYDYTHSPVIPFLREWSLNKKFLYKYDENSSYLMHLDLN